MFWIAFAVTLVVCTTLFTGWWLRNSGSHNPFYSADSYLRQVERRQQARVKRRQRLRAKYPEVYKRNGRCNHD